MALVTTPTAYRLTYRHRPDLWISDCIKWKSNENPSPYQIEIARDLIKYKRVAVRTLHGAGKTALAAWLVHWFATTRDGDTDWKVITTASVFRQLEKYLWPEIHKWAKRIAWGKLPRSPYTEGELLTLSIKLSTGEAFAASSDNASFIEGAHATSLLYIFDEAKTIPAEIWDAAEGAFSTGGDIYVLAISTPGIPAGRFYEIHARRPGYQDWFVRFVKLEEVIEAGRVSEEWVKHREQQWGGDSATFRQRVLGEFSSLVENSVIKLADVQRAAERWSKSLDKFHDIDRIAVDVATGEGGDVSVIALRRGRFIDELIKLPTADTMELVGQIKNIVNRDDCTKEVQIIIDAIGPGSGPYHRLRELGFNVVPFIASERSERLDQSGTFGFVNKRAEAWWTVREMLQADEIDLPPDDDLISDLTAVAYRESSGGKVQLESKDNVKKKLGRSPDAGDAVVMVCWEPPGVGFMTIYDIEDEEAEEGGNL